MNKRKIINDPVYGFITIPTDLIYDIIEHPFFQRLNRIKQLGLSYLVYPGAQHTRFQHALGSMHLMTQTLEVLKSKSVDISIEEAEAATIAILLHDLGHGPFSHTLEHLIITEARHEEITLLMMEQLNNHFQGRLDLAIKIFTGNYHKKFLHQLVSSQLDMDRMDYMNRDSFFTGVSEGVIGYDRIIKMLCVHENEIAVEAKGIYSIEKFLISRRLMYWQVYLHKTVLAAEEMLIKIIERARFILTSRNLDCSSALLWFLKTVVNIDAITVDPKILYRFSELDDYDIFSAIKVWQHDQDFILSFLCSNLLARRLYKIELQNEPFSQQRVFELTEKAKRLAEISTSELNYLVVTSSTSNHAYNPTAESIKILYKEGKVKDISEASDIFNLSVMKQPVLKYYICYPKEIC